MDRATRAVLAATTILAAVSHAVPAWAAPPAPPPHVVDAPVPPLGIGADAAQRILERATGRVCLTCICRPTTA